VLVSGSSERRNEKHSREDDKNTPEISHLPLRDSRTPNIISMDFRHRGHRLSDVGRAEMERKFALAKQRCAWSEPILADDGWNGRGVVAVFTS
jgi:hypothetical protein